VVIDLPISAVLKGDEYQKFFEWAKDLNTYHPNIQDLSFQHLHYYPIRYQTKLYDGRLNSLSIFSEEEQTFLQCYCWLRALPKFFKPKELFSVMQDTQAEEYAEKMLENFEVETGTIRCPDASKLQALIPYVKRLLLLYDQIIKNTKTGFIIT
jgi:hypothetical protein